MSRRDFSHLHAHARRLARKPEEADDLLQEALLAALECGRTDFTSPDTQRWLFGVIRKRALFDARTGGRRRRREMVAGGEFTPVDTVPTGDLPSLDHLSHALRLTALLAFSGHTRQEISWLLNVSDAALRKRISQLKRAIDGAAGAAGAPQGDLAFGSIRRALLAPARQSGTFLASCDPDGHLFAVRRSQNSGRRQQDIG